MTPIVQSGQIAASSKDIITFSGANSTWSDATYYYALFTASGSFTIDGYLVFQSLLVGGGGGGGNYGLAVSGNVAGIGQGGGGGGGYQFVNSNIRGTGVWNVTIGAGGALASAGSQTRIDSVSSPSSSIFENGGTAGQSGFASIGSITNPFGGAGGNSGGGPLGSQRLGGLGGSVYLYASGSGGAAARVASGGGGGGSGTGGSSGSNEFGGAGGSAYTVDVGGWVTSTGSQFVGSAGGKGSAYNGFPLSSSPFYPQAGAANTGDGGGGGAAYYNPSGPSVTTRNTTCAGGSGYAVIRYTRAQVGG